MELSLREVKQLLEDLNTERLTPDSWLVTTPYCLRACFCPIMGSILFLSSESQNAASDGVTCLFLICIAREHKNSQGVSLDSWRFDSWIGHLQALWCGYRCGPTLGTAASLLELSCLRRPQLVHWEWGCHRSGPGADVERLSAVSSLWWNRSRRHWFSNKPQSHFVVRLYLFESIRFILFPLIAGNRNMTLIYTLTESKLFSCCFPEFP